MDSPGRHCYAPVGMTPAMDLPPEIFKVAVEYASNVALAFNRVVTLLGGDHAGAYYCRHTCQYDHPGGVVVVPDVVVLELQAHGNGPTPSEMIKRVDGRSSMLYRI